MGEIFVLLSSVAKNYENSLFYSTKFISKGVTPMILIQMCTLYRPLQASMTPYNLFGKSLFSHFHTEPLFRPGIISKILYSILQYTNKKPYESSYFFIYFSRGMIGTLTQQVNPLQASLITNISIPFILQFTTI